MFTDEAEISIKAGHGGDGIASFRHEKYVPKGGPDGGDGGNGGSIYIIADNNLDTLSIYNSHKKFKAEDGERGKTKKMHGKNGKDLSLKVPLGTIIFEIKDDKKNKVIELLDQDQNYIIAKGGIGGLGNVHFKSSVNQAPREFTCGQKGERKRIFFELRLIADVGLIGLPNAGKSSLISVISNALPKIASYPFTTIIPNLGSVKLQEKNIIFADIPGLIEGASQGKGLGDKFLRHIKRTKLLVHIIDITAVDVINNYQTIRKELESFDKELLNKKEIVIFNKIDLINSKEIIKKEKEFLRQLHIKPVIISTKTKTGLNAFLKLILQELNK